MVTKLNSGTVEQVFLDCLFKDGEDTTGYIKAEGIVTNVGFHPVRLKEHTAEIIELLEELPDEFKKNGGGGWSFLNACNDRHGNQWTDSQRRMEQLFLLGIGIGKVKCQLPREVWKALPGGVPYYVVE